MTSRINPSKLENEVIYYPLRESKKNVKLIMDIICVVFMCNGISQSDYGINGKFDDVFCLFKKDNKWSVKYIERGREYQGKDGMPLLEAARLLFEKMSVSNDEFLCLWSDFSKLLLKNTSKLGLSRAKPRRNNFRSNNAQSSRSKLGKKSIAERLVEKLSLLISVNCLTGYIQVLIIPEQAKIIYLDSNGEWKSFSQKYNNTSQIRPPHVYAINGSYFSSKPSQSLIQNVKVH